jgi:hypothetical protein
MSMSPGAFRANPPPKDPEAMERDLARIPAVSSARVVIADDELVEVHIVCAAGRSPKLVGRDVQSLLAAQWGVDLDHRKVSVVQLEAAEPAEEQGDESPPAKVGRASAAAPNPGTDLSASSTPLVTSVSVSTTGQGAEASVSVKLGGRSATGQAKGVPSWTSQRRLTAEAALAALGELDDRLAGYGIAEVTAVRMGTEDVVVVTVAGWADGLEVNLAGAAAIGPAGELRASADALLRVFSTR